MYDKMAYEADTQPDEVVKKIKELESLENSMQEAEKDLKQLKRAVDEYKQETIPNVLGSCSKWENDQYKISVRDDLFVSVYADKKNDAYEYLESIGKGHTIKRELKVQFGVSALTDEMLDRILPELESLITEKLNEELEREYPDRNAKVYPEVSKGYRVESATLKKLVKDRLLEGYTMPDEIFSVFPTRKAFIKKQG